MKGESGIEVNKAINEDEYAYIYRICQHKEIIGTWQDVANILNEQLGYEYTESRYRKMYAAFSKMFDANRAELSDGDAQLNEIQYKIDELTKAKRQYYDQRREYNRLLIKESRFDHLADELKNEAEKLNDSFPLLRIMPYEGVHNYEREAVLCLSDWHYGMTTNNIWNRYNKEICLQRVTETVNKASEYLQLFNISVLHIILLGDFAAGAIHVGTRVAAEENVAEQLMHVSEILAEAIQNLANVVEYTRVYSTYGNHMRTVQKKNDSMHEDNMERLIPWWLQCRFVDRDDISVEENNYYEFVKLNVLNHNIVATHGDLEDFKNFGQVVNTIFTQKYGEKIEYAIMGDKHHMEEAERVGIEAIIIRCLCGTDEYANSKRLYSAPGQTLLIFNKEEGRECVRNIKFSV